MEVTLEPGELPVPLDKIKREKESPPKQTTQEEIIVDTIIPKLFEDDSGQPVEEEKKTIEQVKTSNDLLAELFQVFNAGKCFLKKFHGIAKFYF